MLRNAPLPARGFFAGPHPTLGVVVDDLHLHPTRFRFLSHIAKDAPHVARDIGIQEITDTLVAAGVRGCVLEEVAQPLGDQAMIGEELGVFAGLCEHPGVIGAVPQIHIGGGFDAVGGRIDRANEQCRGKMCGSRVLIQGLPNPASFMESPDLSDLLKALSERNMVFDLCIFHYQPEQAAAALALVRRHPDVRFNLNHIGKDKIRTVELTPEWATWIVDMGKQLNVFCQVSAIVDEVVASSDGGLWPNGNWRGAVTNRVKAVFEAFPVERRGWAGDFPVSSARMPYSANLAFYVDAVAGLSYYEKQMFFSTAGLRWYGIQQF